ncbi:MAG: serine--tRNA ligase [Spirochaetales bacterium]|jgi:seryl-tRNA synthetase|nr:serine--tRNA ligase [Spirochaetales bacterium]
MIDLKFLKDNLAAMEKNIRDRNMQADAAAVVGLYDRRNALIQEIDSLRTRRNGNAAKMKDKLSAEQRSALIEEGKSLKTEIAAGEEKLETAEKELAAAASRIPNMAHPQAPVGKEDKDNLEIKRSGEPAVFSFKPLDHVQLGEKLDLIDFDTATKVSGTKFYYLKNEAVFLELALTRYALDILVKHGFTPTITPDIAKEEILEGIGFNPRGAESNIYTLEGTGTCLVGTAEITLGGYHSDSVLNKESLPIRMAGLSHCFRREAGAAGQFSKGLYRVHQFSKVEMFVYCAPEDSEEWHAKLLAIEEEIFRGLDIPYRVVDTCTGDLGAPAYRKFDIEAWMPGRGESGEWGEVTSTSNCTDYQSRRLGVRFRDEGRTRYVHMLNGTAIALSRGLIAILENFQEADGSVRIPPRLAAYTGFDRISPKGKASANS